jgi:acyl carrier protein
VIATSDSGRPLGEDGLGLDTLALVEFLAAVEKEFGTKVPVDVWSRIDQLTLDDCAEVVLRATS